MKNSRCPGWARRVAAMFVFALAALFAVDPVVAQDQPAEYRLGPGDEIKVTVFGHDDLSGSFEIDGRGAVSLPLVGSVTAGNLTIQEFEQAIEEALKPDYLINPRVNIQVTNYRPFYILGEVKSPGSYAYVSGMTVVNAVALAGGFTYRAKKDHVLITRGNDPDQRRQKVPTTMVVLPGDVIRVEERFF